MLSDESTSFEVPKRRKDGLITGMPRERPRMRIPRHQHETCDSDMFHGIPVAAFASSLHVTFPNTGAGQQYDSRCHLLTTCRSVVTEVPRPGGCCLAQRRWLLGPRLVVELREPPFIASVGFHDVHLPVVQEGDRAPVG